MHAFHEIDRWQKAASDRNELLADGLFLQRCVHESLRLHPASPVAWRRALENTEVAGHKLQKGEKVIIDLAAANQDVNIFGSDAQLFNPNRPLPNGVWPFGLTFGLGVHACMGRALDGGVLPASNAPHQLGIVTLVVKTLLSLGATVSKDNLPHKDESTSRKNWGYYPVKLRTRT